MLGLPDPSHTAAGDPTGRPIQPQLTIPTFPLPMSFRALRDALSVHDCLPSHDRDQMSADYFLKLSLYPQIASFVGTEYFNRRFGEHRLAQQLRAAFDLGSNRIDEAFETLRCIDQAAPSAFNAVMAARCYMRPPGREADALRYLEERNKSYPDDVTLVGNLATARFIVGDVRGANALLSRIEDELRSRLSALRDEHDALQRELEHAIAQKVTVRKSPYDDTAYLEEAIWAHWEPYFDEMIQEAPHLYFGWYRSFYRKKLIELAKGMEQLYNFGVMCALPDHEAALASPNVQFVGIDRQSETARHNSQAFSASNLQFVDGEIEDFLNAQKGGGKKALFHARTATLCYPEKIRQLYRLCARKGVTRIALFENVSLCHNNYRFMTFDEFPADAVIFKSHQFVHNYPKLLREAGYRVVEERRMFSPSITPFPDIEIGSAHVYIRAEMP